MMKKPKILSALMVLGLSASLLGQVPVMAEEADQTQTTDAAGGITTNSISGWPQASDISSEAAVVMENSTNTVLYSKNADEVLFPGSTVKIMTCLLALENAQLTDQVTMTATGVSGVTDGGASISSQVDEVFTVEQCLYAIMVASANDIALQIAEHVGGSVDNFVQMMNSRAVTDVFKHRCIAGNPIASGVAVISAIDSFYLLIAAKYSIDIIHTQ